MLCLVSSWMFCHQDRKSNNIRMVFLVLCLIFFQQRTEDNVLRLLHNALLWEYAAVLAPRVSNVFAEYSERRVLRATFLWMAMLCKCSVGRALMICDVLLERIRRKLFSAMLKCQLLFTLPKSCRSLHVSDLIFVWQSSERVYDRTLKVLKFIELSAQRHISCSKVILSVFAALWKK